MSVYAVCTAVGSVGSGCTVRRYTGIGTKWIDITANLASLATDSSHWILSDLKVIKGTVVALLKDQYSSATDSVVRWTGTDWVVTQATAALGLGDVILDGFYLHGRTWYVHGSTNNTNFSIWRLTSKFTLVMYASSDTNQNMGRNFTNAWRRCVVRNPHHPNEAVIGDALDDRFGWFNFQTKTFHPGSDPGGSCVFALGVDGDKTIWAGDYNSYFYYSNDGRKFSTAIIGDSTAGLLEDYPEIWGMASWRGELYAVGCHPTGIIKRRPKHKSSLNLADSWQIIYNGPMLRDGIGMMCMTPEYRGTGRLFIGYGAEPFYYARDPYEIKPTVYTWNGKHLTDIGLHDDWGTGPYILQNSDTLGDITAGNPRPNGVHFW